MNGGDDGGGGGGGGANGVTGANGRRMSMERRNSMDLKMSQLKADRQGLGAHSSPTLKALHRRPRRCRVVPETSHGMELITSKMPCCPCNRQQRLRRGRPRAR
jgi:hypothetical protein